MTYDGQSRRIRLVEKIRSGSAWTPQSDHRYLWEGTSIVQKRDATGASVTAKFYDQCEIRITGSTSTPYHFSRDHLGSIREVVANNGTVAARFDYTAWGERSTVSGGSFELEWGFTGHHYHAKSGLHIAMFRAYDANLGRWLSEDPVGEVGGLNLYGYVRNAPLSFVDPNGLDTWIPNLIRDPVTAEDLQELHEFDEIVNAVKNWNLQSPPWSPSNQCRDQAVSAIDAVVDHFLTKEPRNIPVSKYFKIVPTSGSKVPPSDPKGQVKLENAHNVVAVIPRRENSVLPPMILDPYKAPVVRTSVPPFIKEGSSVDVKVDTLDSFRKKWPHKLWNDLTCP